MGWTCQLIWLLNKFVCSTVWLLSTPACPEVNRTLQKATDVTYEASTPQRDFKDSIRILQYAIARNPFDNRKELMSIGTGEIAITTVNVDQAKKIGSDILESMCGNPTKDYTFRKKDMAITMNRKRGQLSK